MPTFCRHNRLIQNCPICSREQDIEARPLVSSSSPATSRAQPWTTRRPASSTPRTPGLTVRRLRSAVDDGYRSPLVPGLKSSEEAERLAFELAFAATRTGRLEHDPPGLYAEVASRGSDVEERAWLAFLVAYLGPLEAEDPFAGIRAVRTSWSSGELPDLHEVPTGPRSAHDPNRGAETLEAYRNWAARAGSQAQAFRGEASWSPERRFARVFERLALPGLHRGARFDLLLTLGRTGTFDLGAGALSLGGSDEVSLAAKRALGIGDSLLLERRAAQLADASGVSLEALDLAFYNWEGPQRSTGGVGPAEPDPEILSQAAESLGV